MVEKDKYLVVVSVRQGKNFPKRPKHELIVEAKFEGELLTTDPVEHNEAPDFTQELAWELDKKSLHQHRMQRTSVKVQVYCQDMVSSVREAIGYVVLDLRSAQDRPTLKWFPLLHTKYRRSKPFIELSLYIDEGKNDAATTRGSAEKTREATSVKHFIESVDPKLLKPVLIDAEGFYQIGPVAAGSEKFVLSTTVAFASNLVQLVPTNINLPSSGYFFYYSLLGNDVTTEVFSDLLNPSFPAERASIRLAGHLEVIRQFFSCQPGLELHLCCGDQSLGSCQVPLNNLIKKGSTEIYMKPLSVEGAFQLFPPKSAKLSDTRALPENQKPVVGVSLVLRREAEMGRSPPVKDVPLSKSEPNVGDRAQQETQAQRGTRAPSKTISVPPEQGIRSLPSPVSPHDGSYTETFETETKSDDRLNDIFQTDKKQEQVTDLKSGNVNPCQNVVERTTFVESREVESRATTGDDVSSGTQPHHEISVPPVPHHFRVSIDLKCVANLDVTHPTSVFLKYTYIFFGSSSPVFTEPPVEVRRGTEVTLPKSFCAFDFATTFAQLEDTFTRVPLVIEVWHRDRQLSQNSCLGVVQVALSSILKSNKSKALHSSGSSGWKQTSTDWLPILSTDGEQSHFGDLRLALSLEDWGPIVQQTVIIDKNSQRHETVAKSQSPIPTRETRPRETIEYKAAMELELWKEQQQKMFDEELRIKEKQHLRELEDEYKRRDKERLMLVAKEKSEFDKMVEVLRKTLTDLEKRDKLLAAREQEVVNYKTSLEHEHERKMNEIRDASRRLKEDCDHQVALERNKIKDFEETIVRLKQRIVEEESKHQKLGREFDAFKDKINVKPEVRLQAEITQLMMEKVTLEKQLDAAVKSKVHYKQQWAHAMRSLAKRNNKDLKDARAKERQRKLELDQMKLHYQLRKETEAENKELNQIKKDMQQFEKSHATVTQSDFVGEPNGHLISGMNFESVEDDDDHLTRLIMERDTLLKTGAYSIDDSIIVNLEREIRDSMSKRKGEKTRSTFGDRNGHSIY